MSCFDSEMAPKGSHLEHSSQLVELCWRAVKSFRDGDKKVPRGRTLKGMPQATLCCHRNSHHLTLLAPWGQG